MLQYKNFKFNDKQDFVDYIEKRMIDYWKNHNNSFSNVCEEFGFLGDNRVYQMYDFDNMLDGTKPSEIVQMLDSDFNYSDDYFYFDGYGKLCSTNEKEYFNSVSYSEVFEKLIDDYDANVFTAHHGYAYYTLFDDIYDIMNIYDEDEIQENMNDDYYKYLFEDDKDFFSDDDLDE